MTAQEHLRHLRRLEQWGQGLRALCTVPLLLNIFYTKQPDGDAACTWFAVFTLFYAVDRFLLYRVRAHLECVGRQFKELYP